ncbi:MAG: glycosyltransferase family 2 protein [Acidobacteria bacterium]|nr:glycosyltransferase family 2 protein [Acidobacteriota bacterium]
MKVSIIIPVYNEINVLDQVMERVLQAPLPDGMEREIIVVDDGSTDGTTELLKQYHETPLVVVHHSQVNFGKGAALRIGIANATGDFILVQDGDMEYDPNDWVRVLTPLAIGAATVVYGSRFQGRPKGMKFANWLANKILTGATNLLYGAEITDEATAYKAFRADVLASIRLRCIRFEFCPEVTAKVRRMGHVIHEVPISYNARGVLEGKKIRWQDGVEALWTLLRYRWGTMEQPLPARRPPSTASTANARAARSI